MLCNGSYQLALETTLTVHRTQTPTLSIQQKQDVLGNIPAEAAALSRRCRRPSAPRPRPRPPPPAVPLTPSAVLPSSERRDASDSLRSPWV